MRRILVSGLSLFLCLLAVSGGQSEAILCFHSTSFCGHTETQHVDEASCSEDVRHCGRDACTTPYCNGCIDIVVTGLDLEQARCEGPPDHLVTPTEASTLLTFLDEDRPSHRRSECHSGCDPPVVALSLIVVKILVLLI